MICWKVSLVHQNKNFSIKEKTFVVHQEVLSNTGINWPHMEKLWINSSAASARVPHPSSFILCCLHSLGAEGEMDLQSALLTANTEWKTDLQGHWELLFQLKNTGLCLICCCTRVQGISVKAGWADGRWNFLSHRSHTSRGIGGVGPGGKAPLRGAGPRTRNDTSLLFMLSLIFLGKIERTVF